MKVLILDDEYIRHNAYDARYSDAEVHHVYTVDQFRKVAPRHLFEIVHFDHDLGTKETGLDAAEWFVRSGCATAGVRCVVHSWNPTGGLRIFDTLHRAGFDVVRELFSVGPTLTIVEPKR